MLNLWDVKQGCPVLFDEEWLRATQRALKNLMDLNLRKSYGAPP